ncbi:unnamed protein product [Microthlaspi erraticum]|uniref:NYN domain-containing protein n=1 Tax=Microthlaspi erraticum TaxID=1685480 RepID=A0A6D2J8Q9_9BRAS|nr:unnamed protein product [Microthlaspi erraticum]
MSIFKLKNVPYSNERRVNVFWDIEDCKIPDGSSLEEVASNIKSALKNAGCVGPVSLFAYGNTKGKEMEFFPLESSQITYPKQEDQRIRELGQPDGVGGRGPIVHVGPLHWYWGNLAAGKDPIPYDEKCRLLKEFDWVMEGYP